MRFMKLQGRTLYIFFDETMARPDMKLDLFYEGCEVKRKKFKHSGEFSDSQFWLQLSIPADSTSTDPEMGPMAFDMISVLCEVDSHSLHPWLALLEGAISGTYIAQGSRGRAALRSAPCVSVEPTVVCSFTRFMSPMKPRVARSFGHIQVYSRVPGQGNTSDGTVVRQAHSQAHNRLHQSSEAAASGSSQLSIWSFWNRSNLQRQYVVLV